MNSTGPRSARTSGSLRRGGVSTAVVAALALTGCGTLATVQAGSGAAHVSPTAPIDRLAAIAQARYAAESGGGGARERAREIADDTTVRAALKAGDIPRLRRYVRVRFRSVWYHQHVSRLRVLRRSRVEVDVGVPFVVAPVSRVMRDSGGRPLGTIQVSIQDEIGFVRYMTRHYPVDVVVRGQGPRHARTSLPAALRVTLPDKGVVSVAGRPYQVRSFPETALGGEPVKVSILQRA